LELVTARATAPQIGLDKNKSSKKFLNRKSPKMQVFRQR